MSNNGSLIPVSEHHGLYRDAHSNCIVNTDRAAYNNALQQRENCRKHRAEIEEMKNQISDLIRRVQILEDNRNK